MKDKLILNLRDRSLEIEKPAIMGIINATPDSFSDGGQNLDISGAMKSVERMLKEGVDLIDIGGESSRPGSNPVSVHEERERVIPIIKEVRKEFDIPLSIDTTKSEIAREALNEGADIVNDISALRFSEGMAELIAKTNVPVILMHMKGIPRSMQINPDYENVTAEIKNFFIERTNFSESKGIKLNKIILDPGIGFGKKIEDNIEIIRNIREFSDLGFPVLIGLSLKSFLASLAGEPDPKGRLSETITANIISVLYGASILRVHDVGPCRKSISILNGIVPDGEHLGG